MGSKDVKIEHIGNATIYLADCMDIMKDMPDKSFELAIVDPPYGGAMQDDWNGKKHSRFKCKSGVFSRYGVTDWDLAPPPEYFEELFRVSKHQIIWGGNYFRLPPSRNFLIWRKLTISENFSMAMAEYAWTDISGNAKVFDCAPQGTISDPRFHPTQKPVALYKWVLSLFAKHGDTILDTHMGSGSLEVACAELDYKVTGIEINEEYFTKACKRIKEATMQQKLFDYQKIV